MKIIFRVTLFLCSILLAGCQTHFSAPKHQQYIGQGPAEVAVTWDGPAVLHIRAQQGQQTFKAAVAAGIDIFPLVESAGSVDEYRGYTFSADFPVVLSLNGDRAWEIDLLAPTAGEFPLLKIPGKYAGEGNAVVLLEGRSSLATFDIDQLDRLEAWAYAADGKIEKLTFKQDGDYKGKSVLPHGTSWLVVSADGPWSVSILEPCCEIH
jgi:hypothetical protein